MNGSPSICVVGAGPAGLVTAKVFMDDGFDVTVFEKYDEIGGTWSSYRRYLNLNHQLDKGAFEFSDLPNDGAFQNAEEVQQYLAEYADRFDISEAIQFETEVTSITEEEDGWTVATRTEGSASPIRTSFDYVAVCSGMHHLPKTPDVPGLDSFDGPTVHSSQVDDSAMIEDKRVVVIGGGKSAHDLSVEAAKLDSSVTMVFRRANWMVAKNLLGGKLPHRFILYSRFGESLLPKYYNDDCVRLLDRIPAPVKDALWNVVNQDIIDSGGLDRVPDELVPDTQLRHHITHAGVMPEDFTNLVESGDISPVKSTVDRVDDQGVHLDNGQYIEADVIVFATGFRKEIPAYDGDVDLKVDGERFYLYRSIVHPELDSIGFIGVRQTFNNLLSMEISAHWLSAYFQNELVEMPSTEEMRRRIERRLEWKESQIPNTEGFDYGPYNLHAADELLQDMGVQTRRVNPLAEYFLPRARARYYDDLHEERNQAPHTTNGLTGSVVNVLTSTILP